MGNITWAYFIGMDGGVAKDEQRAIELYHKAALQGHLTAQYEFARNYQLGRGLNKNIIEAIWWYQRAAEKGSGPALYRLGEMYYLGLDVEQDLSRGRNMLVTACARNNILYLKNASLCDEVMY